MKKLIFLIALIFLVNNIYSQVVDRSGQVYTVVSIYGNYVMSENYRGVKYRNGSNLDYVTDSTEWLANMIGTWCYYNNVSTEYLTYGRLYNFFAIKDSRGLCPIGWHVITKTELEDLSDYLGGYGSAGGPLKETGTSHWTTPNTGATNSTGFTAIPNGYRSGDLDIERTERQFKNKGNYSFYWLKDSCGDDFGNYFKLSYDNNDIEQNINEGQFGYSVRCVKEGSTFPSAPTGVSATDGTCNHVDITWNAVSGVESYIVVRGSSLVGSTTSTSYIDNNASTSSTIYKVWSVDDVNGPSNSYGSNYGYKTNCAPEAPTGVVATDGTYADKVVITWNAVDYATSYIVKRGDTQIGTPTACTLDDAGASCTSTTYKVYAVNEYGTSASYGSNNGNKGVPAAPASITCANPITSCTVHQTFTCAASTGATSYTWTWVSNPADVNHGPTGTTTSCYVHFNCVDDNYAQIMVQGVNACGTGPGKIKSFVLNTP